MFERDTSVSTMSTQVARIIGTRIVSGEFRPGAALPIEAELCLAYRVSRSTVREAIKNLAAKRLLEVSPKVGTRVLPFADWNLLDLDVLSWRLNAQFDERIIDDLYEVRQCIEPRACFLAAKVAMDEDHDKIRRRFDDLVSVLNQPMLAAGAETEFHLAIIAGTHNGLFMTIGAAVKAAMRVSFSLTQKGLHGQPLDLSLYRTVLDAILQRRPGKARAAMSVLLDFSRQRVLAALQKSG